MRSAGSATRCAISRMWPSLFPCTSSCVSAGSSAANASDSIALSVSRSFSRCCSPAKTEPSVMMLDDRSSSTMFGHTASERRVVSLVCTNGGRGAHTVERGRDKKERGQRLTAGDGAEGVVVHCAARTAAR